MKKIERLAEIKNPTPLQSIEQIATEGMYLQVSQSRKKGFYGIIFGPFNV